MAAEAIDWAAAVRAGQRLAPTGPDVSPEQARAAVEDLQQFSAKAELIVRDTTGLGHGLPVESAQIVDRARWIAATAEGMAELTAPLADKLAGRLGQASKAKAAAGAQLGIVLGFLSGRVLGQYDPLSRPPGDGSVDGPPGRLLLVAPNIIKVERELHADPVDFRMWVCLHESTHRLQFTAVPWLREHFRGLVGDFGAAADTDANEMLGRLVSAIRGRDRKGVKGSGGGQSWIETIQTPEQRVVFDSLMALMTLLEGHADHIMDAVGPTVIPSVSDIRSSFSARRKRGRGPIDRLLRSLLGMDMKLAQYVKGAAFVSGVVDRVGMDAFNTIWTSPETLPTRAETTDPESWIKTGPAVSLDLVESAVRQWVDRFGSDLALTVACSGGADSLALAAGVFAVVDQERLNAVTVDHQLQSGSAAQAVATAAQLHEIGYRTVRIDTIKVGTEGGPEAAARLARYRTLLPESAHAAVLLAHTADDQAETVLLGLARGSGPRSIAAMTPWRRPWGRPLLGLRRTQTENACREAGLNFWEDPQNRDPAFTRVRLRHEVLPLMEDVLGGGVVPALARTAQLLAEDLEALDYLAARVLAQAWEPGGAVDLEELGRNPVALRRRALRAWANAVGAKSLTSDHLMRLDGLAVGDRRSGAVRLPGALDAVRSGSTLRAVPAG